MNTIDTREAGGCFCRSRDRFEREFIRAKNADAKLYLLIENGTWEKAYAASTAAVCSRRRLSRALRHGLQDITARSFSASPQRRKIDPRGSLP